MYEGDYECLTLQMPAALMASAERLGAWVGATNTGEVFAAAVNLSLYARSLGTCMGSSAMDWINSWGNFETIAELHGEGAISIIAGARMEFGPEVLCPIDGLDDTL